jgi:DHA1 family tetracycline resistance protein-like MFS transporter
MTNKYPSSLVFVLITLFLDVMGIGLSNPILPKLINQIVGDISTAAYYFGVITTTYALMLFVFSPIQGALSDQFGRKPVLLLSLLGTGLSYLGLTVAPSLPWLFAAQILNGLTGASFAVAAAYVADISKAENRAQNFGLIGTTLALGWVIGPALGGLLSLWGLRVPFLIAAIVTFLNLFYGLLVVPESHKLEHRRAFSWRVANPMSSLGLLRQNTTILGLAAVIFCADLALQCFISTWVLFTTYKFHWGAFEAGLSLALLGLMTAVVQGGIIRPVVARFGERRTIVAGLSFSLIGYLLYTLPTQGWMMYGVIVLNGFDYAVKPISQSLLSGLVSARQQGAIQGALASQTALATIVGPLLATNLFAYFISVSAPHRLPEIPFWLGALLFLLALGLAVMTFSRELCRSPSSKA